MISNSLFIQAAFGHPTARPPVWFMRQAGRFMKEYWDIKEKYSFLEMVKTPEIAADVTMLPVDLLGIDAAIMFCDILVVAEAMGAKLEFHAGKGPQFLNPIASAEHIEQLVIPNVGETLGYVKDMIGIVKGRLPEGLPLIGFAGAPFTVMSYLIEGGSSKDFKKTKAFIHNRPDWAHALLDKIATVTTAYLNMQIDAGVNALQLFDSWAIALDWQDYHEFSHAYNKKIIGGLHRTHVPVISFCKGSSVFAPLMAEALPNVISIDWNADLANIKRALPPGVAVQGNLDPSVLYAEKPAIKRKILQLFERMRGLDGFIFNLGHGIMPDIPFDHVKYAIEITKEFSWQ